MVLLASVPVTVLAEPLVDAAETRSAARGGAAVPGDAIAAHAPVLTSVAQVKAAWNRAAADIQPYASIQSIRADGSGHLFAQVGTHVFLTGFVTPSDYALDVMLDHPETNMRAAVEQLLPYWQILIRTTGPESSLHQADAVLRKLGVLNAGLKVPNRFQVNAVRVSSGAVQYALSYADGLVLSAERGAKGTDDQRDLDWEYKQVTVLASGSFAYPVSRAEIDMRLKQNPAPRIREAVLHGKASALFDELQRVARWTVSNLDWSGALSSSENDRAAGWNLGVPVLAEDGVRDIALQLAGYYMPAFVQHLLHDEVWAHWVKGTVKGETLVESADTVYAQGRVFLVSEPPFSEGQAYEFVLPLYADGTNYALRILSVFGQLPPSSLKRMAVSGNQVSVTVSFPHAGMGTPAGQGTYVFHLQRIGGQVRINGIDVPPMQGE
ncbi:MAG: hypothetical protein K6T30_06180 [Alicyclobacillus sp.]|nr:hypothetical protein [Alicyclobacillus sp.]